MSENMIKQLGAVPEPVEVLWHKPEVAQAGLEFGAKVGAWDAADESLKTFAHMAVAAQVGCSWCLDINYFQAQNENLDLAKASEVPRWRDSAGFSCSCVGFRPELGSSGGGGRFVAGLDRFRQTGPTPCKHESLGSLRDAVEAAPDVAHQGMPDNEHSGGTARLQSTHRSEAFFQEAVVTFDAIGAVAASSMQYARHHRGRRTSSGARQAGAIQRRHRHIQR